MSSSKEGCDSWLISGWSVQYLAGFRVVWSVCGCYGWVFGVCFGWFVGGLDDLRAGLSFKVNDFRDYKPGQ